MFIDKLTEILGWESFHAKECKYSAEYISRANFLHKFSKLNTDAQFLDKIYVSWQADHATL